MTGWRGAPLLALFAILFGLTGLALALSACEPNKQPFGGGSGGGLAGEPGPHGPIVRVRVIRGARSVVIDSPGRVVVRPATRAAVRGRAGSGEIVLASSGGRVGRDPLDGDGLSRDLPTPVTFNALPGGKIEVVNRSGGRLHLTGAAVDVRPNGAHTIGVGGVEYPGTLVVHRLADDGSPGGAVLDVVNHVGMELYLPGVLHRELYSSWDAAAFEAQAVAARSYALAQCDSRATRSHFDLESTQASQVYGGAKAGRRARAGVEVTRGWVLVHGGRVLPAYYSSTCGGRGQDASAAFPNGTRDSVLAGRPHGHWCKASPKFRWGPVERSRLGLSRRIAAWGRLRGHPVSRLSMLDRIDVAERNGAGRPGRFLLRGTDGAGYELSAEQLRHACNYGGDGLPELGASEQLPSSDISVTVAGPRVVFHGRGYGHGVGMCQWGAQGMAEAGRGPAEILGFFYPGASLKRLY